MTSNDVTINWQIVQWVADAFLPFILGWAIRIENQQSRQDLALKDLQLDIANNRPHNDDFKELERTVRNVDRLVRLIAAKQGIPVYDDR